MCNIMGDRRSGYLEEAGEGISNLLYLQISDVGDDDQNDIDCQSVKHGSGIPLQA